MWTYDRFTQRPLAAGLPAVALHLHRQNRKKETFPFPMFVSVYLPSIFQCPSCTEASKISVCHWNFLISSYNEATSWYSNEIQKRNGDTLSAEQFPSDTSWSANFLGQSPDAGALTKTHRLPPSLCDPTAFLMSTTAPPKKSSFLQVFSGLLEGKGFRPISDSCAASTVTSRTQTMIWEFALIQFPFLHLNLMTIQSIARRFDDNK